VNIQYRENLKRPLRLVLFEKKLHNIFSNSVYFFIEGFIKNLLDAILQILEVPGVMCKPKE
jgi:hypothetical protein